MQHTGFRQATFRDLVQHLWLGVPLATSLRTQAIRVIRKLERQRHGFASTLPGHPEQSGSLGEQHAYGAYKLARIENALLCLLLAMRLREP